MDPQVTAQADALARLYLFPFALKVLSAPQSGSSGGWAIHLIRGAFSRAMRIRHVDATLTRYLDASANVLLKVLVLIAILGVLGIQTTSFAALMAPPALPSARRGRACSPTSRRGCSC
jgi:small conductance mechanosensitive channel